MGRFPVLFVYGQRERYGNYAGAVADAGGRLRFSLEIREAGGCDGLLLPGGGDLEPWRYPAPPPSSPFAIPLHPRRRKERERGKRGRSGTALQVSLFSFTA